MLKSLILIFFKYNIYASATVALHQHCQVQKPNKQFTYNRAIRYWDIVPCKSGCSFKEAVEGPRHPRLPRESKSSEAETRATVETTVVWVFPVTKQRVCVCSQLTGWRPMFCCRSTSASVWHFCLPQLATDCSCDWCRPSAWTSLSILLRLSWERNQHFQTSSQTPSGSHLLMLDLNVGKSFSWRSCVKTSPYDWLMRYLC